MHNHIPRKRFGQNFLHDRLVIDKIVRAIAPNLEDDIVEIGPGLGALTTRILPIVKKMTAIELDRDVVPKLSVACQSLGELKIFQADALTFDFTQLGSAAHPLRIIGNLPYNISTPLLFHLLAQAALIRDMHFMLQKEVVDRMVAEPHSKEYGRLSVMIQYYCRVEKLFIVPPGAFFPAPKVYSAVIRMQPQQPALIAKNTSIFADIVKQAFSQRRKTLRNTLKDKVNDKQWEQLQIDPQLRAEELTVADFVRISNLM